MRYSGGGDVSAQVAPVEPDSASSGCERSAFAGFPRGAVALVRRGTCFMSLKARNAKAAGASGVLIANEGGPGRTAPILGTLIRRGISILCSGSRRRSARSWRVRLRRARCGCGSFFGSEPTGTVGERARRPAGAPGRCRPARRAPRLGRERGRDQRQRIRLGARARGRAASSPPRYPAGARTPLRILGCRGARARGSSAYVQTSERAESAGSCSPCSTSTWSARRTSAASSTTATSSRPARRGSRAFSAPISQLAGSRWKRCPSRAVQTTHRSHGPASRSVASSRGRTRASPADLAQRFGGAADRPYDPCYHQACDTLSNINLRVLGQMADAAAVVALRLAG